MPLHIFFRVLESEEPSGQTREGTPGQGACGTTADEKQGKCIFWLIRKSLNHVQFVLVDVRAKLCSVVYLRSLS